MLKGDVIDGGYTHDFFWQQAAILAMGLAVTAAIVFTAGGGGMLISVLVVAGWILFNYFVFFRRGVDVGVTLPVASTLAVLGVLAIANYLVVGRERRFIRKAFQQNVSPSILGYLETHPDRLSSLDGDYRHMTVLFTDIRGFTTISETLSAPEVARFLNEYFTPMSDIVMTHAGTVDKFIGDGLMAFWNAPADNPRHAKDAAESALDMLARLGDLQQAWTNRGLPHIAIGCAINTGPMFAGYMGSDQRKNYTVMGDSVNVASRIEGLNKVYSTSILISESTREELGKDFVCRVVDKVRVSGKADAVLIHELIGHGPASEDTAEELAAFKRVFDLYQEREFAAAQSLLKELVFIRPSPLYKMYMDRLAIYKALPPPPDWDGTFSMTQK
jgi:adenylate cyclase